MNPRKLLRELYFSVTQKYPRQFKKSLTRFCFEEIDDTPMGRRLIVKDKGFFGKPVVEVDITDSPSSYDRNQLVIKQDRTYLVATVKQFLENRKIPYNLRTQIE